MLSQLFLCEVSIEGSRRSEAISSLGINLLTVVNLDNVVRNIGRFVDLQEVDDVAHVSMNILVVLEALPGEAEADVVGEVEADEGHGEGEISEGELVTSDKAASIKELFKIFHAVIEGLQVLVVFFLRFGETDRVEAKGDAILILVKCLLHFLAKIRVFVREEFNVVVFDVFLGFSRPEVLPVAPQHLDDVIGFRVDDLLGLAVDEEGDGEVILIVFEFGAFGAALEVSFMSGVSTSDGALGIDEFVTGVLVLIKDPRFVTKVLVTFLGVGVGEVVPGSEVGDGDLVIEAAQVTDDDGTAGEGAAVVVVDVVAVGFRGEFTTFLSPAEEPFCGLFSGHFIRSSK